MAHPMESPPPRCRLEMPLHTDARPLTDRRRKMLDWAPSDVRLRSALTTPGTLRRAEPWYRGHPTHVRCWPPVPGAGPAGDHPAP
jgi:hypothetical protein